MPMALFEVLCAAIVVAFVLARSRLAPRSNRLIANYLALAAGAWLSEQSVIELYQFYRYTHGWHGFVGVVPLAIALIWPAVIISANDIATAICKSAAIRTPLVAALLVFFDAWMIEPIAVRAGLWRWSHPGLFDVPPIGVLGWALFAATACWLLHRNRHPLLLAILPPLLLHPALLATWWGALRWLDRPIAPWLGPACFWPISLVATWWLLRQRSHRNVPLSTMLLRIPPSALFFVLLALHRPSMPLVLSALAFAPPYLALTDLAALWRKSHN
ncbi:MAG: carotenoid biosynthesis protein [Deltaproteobacteria bacterium]|nr:carotenoid biosynthesis protein [Deltaproteobacteria bacterium]